MAADELKNLLRQADVDNPPPILGERRLADGARVSLRQRRRRRATTAAIAILLLGAGLALIYRPGSRSAPLQNKPLATAQPKLRDLESQIALEDETVARLEAADHLRIVQRQLGDLERAGDLSDYLEATREQNALQVLEGAAYGVASTDRTGIYRQVIELFPGTGAAVVARQRLGQIH